ncbi:MAG: hypothetical protein PHV34_24295 [Verrucomicrobiae bacterium]|nr:hypothetical protein [Verrucomicrobiae bacterium]
MKMFMGRFSAIRRRITRCFHLNYKKNPQQTQQSDLQGCQSMTLIELLTVITIISTLFGLLSLALRSLSDKCKQVKCMNNIRQCGMAILEYSRDYEGQAPAPWNGSREWFRLLQDKNYLPQGSVTNKADIVLACPSFPQKSTSYYSSTYGLNCIHGDWGRSMLIANDPVVDNVEHLNLGCSSDCIILADSIFAAQNRQYYYFMADYPYPTSQTSIHLRHNDHANCFFADGHVSSCEANDLKQTPRIWYCRQLDGTEKKL